MLILGKGYYNSKFNTISINKFIINQLNLSIKSNKTEKKIVGRNIKIL